jgi:hypothetical protein
MAIAAGVGKLSEVAGGPQVSYGRCWGKGALADKKKTGQVRLFECSCLL